MWMISLLLVLFIGLSSWQQVIFNAALSMSKIPKSAIQNIRWSDNLEGVYAICFPGDIMILNRKSLFSAPRGIVDKQQFVKVRLASTLVHEYHHFNCKNKGFAEELEAYSAEFDFLGTLFPTQATLDVIEDTEDSLNQCAENYGVIIIKN